MRLICGMAVAIGALLCCASVGQADSKHVLKFSGKQFPSAKVTVGGRKVRLRCEDSICRVAVRRGSKVTVTSHNWNYGNWQWRGSVYSDIELARTMGKYTRGSVCLKHHKALAGAIWYVNGNPTNVLFRAWGCSRGVLIAKLRTAKPTIIEAGVGGVKVWKTAVEVRAGRTKKVSMSTILVFKVNEGQESVQLNCINGDGQKMQRISCVPRSIGEQIYLEPPQGCNRVELKRQGFQKVSRACTALGAKAKVIFTQADIVIWGPGASPGLIAHVDGYRRFGHFEKGPGKYVLPGFSPGTYKLKLTRPGWISSTETVTVGETPPGPVVNSQLRRPRLAVKAPVGAEVTVEDKFSGNVVTRAPSSRQGVWHYELKSLGKYSITVKRRRRLTLQKEVEALGGDVEVVMTEMTSPKHVIRLLGRCARAAVYIGQFHLGFTQNGIFKVPGRFNNGKKHKVVIRCLGFLDYEKRRLFGDDKERQELVVEMEEDNSASLAIGMRAEGEVVVGSEEEVFVGREVGGGKVIGGARQRKGSGRRLVREGCAGLYTYKPNHMFRVEQENGKRLWLRIESAYEVNLLVATPERLECVGGSANGKRAVFLNVPAHKGTYRVWVGRPKLKRNRTARERNGKEMVPPYAIRVKIGQQRPADVALISADDTKTLEAEEEYVGTLRGTVPHWRSDGNRGAVRKRNMDCVGWGSEKASFRVSAFKGDTLSIKVETKAESKAELRDLVLVAHYGKNRWACKDDMEENGDTTYRNPTLVLKDLPKGDVDFWVGAFNLDDVGAGWTYTAKIERTNKAKRREAKGIGR
jgi:hypothetical protein